MNIAIDEDDNELFGYIPPSPVVGLSNISIQVDFGNIHNFKVLTHLNPYHVTLYTAFWLSWIQVDNILELYVVIHIGTEVEQGSLTCTFGVDSVEEIEIEISVFGEVCAYLHIISLFKTLFQYMTHNYYPLGSKSQKFDHIIQ